MTELGENLEDPSLRQKNKVIHPKHPLLSKEMNEFYDKHSKIKEGKPVKPYAVEVNRPHLASP